MKTYEIWSEGFIVMEGHGRAHYHGSIEANSFKEACDKFAEANKSFKSYYDSEKMTHWGCSLYDNEADARKNFG